MPTTRTMTRPERLAWTPDEADQRLVAESSVALLVGFLLDQQIRIQVAFRGPRLLLERLGHLDPAGIARMPEAELEAAFAQKPPLHRYPNSMARRTKALMEFLVERYDGDPDLIWLEADDLADLRRRLTELPGYGKGKAVVVSAVLAHQFGMDFPGWREDLPPYGAIALCDSLDDLEDYQARKGEYKKAAKAAKATSRT